MLVTLATGPATPYAKCDQKKRDPNDADDVRHSGKCAGHVAGVRPDKTNHRPADEQNDIAATHSRIRRAVMIRAYTGRLSVCEHDDAILVGVELRSRLERDAAEGNRDIHSAGTVLPTWPRVRPKRLHAKPEPVERDRIANASVDDDPGPTIVERESCDLVAEQRTPKGTATVHDENSSIARPVNAIAQEHVVLVAADSGNAPCEIRPTELPELNQTDRRAIAMLINDIGRQPHEFDSSRPASGSDAPVCR